MEETPLIRQHINPQHMNEEEALKVGFNQSFKRKQLLQPSPVCIYLISEYYGMFYMRYHNIKLPLRDKLKEKNSQVC